MTIITMCLLCRVTRVISHGIWETTRHNRHVKIVRRVASKSVTSWQQVGNFPGYEEATGTCLVDFGHNVFL